MLPLCIPFCKGATLIEAGELGLVSFDRNNYKHA